jgi:flagellar biosynthesis protein FlhB
MAEDNYSRTEPASARRLAQARAGGDVPRSFDLSSLAVLAVMVAGLMWWGAHLFATLQNLLAAHFRSVTQFSLESAFSLLQQIGLAAIPFLAALFLAGLLAPMLLSGWVFAPRVVQFQGGRLNPFSRLLRLFSPRGLFDSVKAIVVWLAAGAALAWLFRTHLDELARMTVLPLDEAAALAGDLLLHGLLLLLGAALLVALLDVPWQWWRYLKRLAMTRAEVLAEEREAEGSPELKARIRTRQQRMQKGAAE